MPTPFAARKAVSGTPLCEAWPGSPESLARGMLIKGLPVNPGELSTSPDIWARLRPTQRNQVPWGTRDSPREANKPSTRRTCRQGKPEAQGRVGEQSYDSIVPMKVENRRAPEKGRPRYPLEGRDEQVDVSAQRHMHETLNSRRYVKWICVEEPSVSSVSRT